MIFTIKTGIHFKIRKTLKQDISMYFPEYFTLQNLSSYVLVCLIRQQIRN